MLDMRGGRGARAGEKGGICILPFSKHRARLLFNKKIAKQRFIRRQYNTWMDEVMLSSFLFFSSLVSPFIDVQKPIQPIFSYWRHDKEHSVVALHGANRVVSYCLLYKYFSGLIGSWVTIHTVPYTTNMCSVLRRMNDVVTGVNLHGRVYRTRAHT